VSAASTSTFTLSFHLTGPDLQMFSPCSLYSYDTSKSQAAPTLYCTFHKSCCKDHGGSSAKYWLYNILLCSLSFSYS